MPTFKSILKGGKIATYRYRNSPYVLFIESGFCHEHPKAVLVELHEVYEGGMTDYIETIDKVFFEKNKIPTFKQIKSLISYEI